MFWNKKPKTKLAELRMSDRDDPLIKDLYQNEEGMVTGVMGGCCTIILLWGVATTGGRFNHVRGQHGAGGPGNINWDRMLHGFERSTNSLLVMSCAKSDYEASHGSYIEKVKDAVRSLNLNCRRAFYPYSNAIVWRSGKVEECGIGPSASVYDIRR